MNIIISFLILIILYIILQFYCNNIDVIEFDSNVKGINLLLIGGTHGNEPSGFVALTQFIKDMKEKKYNLKTGKITIIAKPNKLGLFFNRRNLLHRLTNKDLNRNYPRNAKEKPLDPISAKIIEYVNKSDWVLDFHEGWGYIYENKGSMGSGIFPGNTKDSITMANNILTSINSAINGKNKFGLEEGKHPDIRSLKSYANYLQKNYILIETSGQNDIQPIEIRVEQILFVIDFFLRFNDMI
jgi:predicted deacylase